MVEFVIAMETFENECQESFLDFVWSHKLRDQ